MKKLFLPFAALFTVIAICSFASLAQSPQNATPDPALSEPVRSRAGDYTAFLHERGQLGPAQIAIRDQATLVLSQGYAFIGGEAAENIMHGIGNQTNETFVGLIFPDKEDIWFIEVDYMPEGYIEDTDAKNWNIDSLLKDIRESTEANNKARATENIPALEILGWVEKPRYDETTNRLIWSISARDKGETDPSKSIINYRTLMLGREGYIDMTMVTNLEKIEAQKPIAQLMLTSLNYNSGKKYADFNSSTDKIASYGLGALVAGVAAKKLGLFAIIAAFAAKFIKVIIFAALAFLAGLSKKFSRKKDVVKTPDTTTLP